MPTGPTVALIRASLPSYFPERHDVWRRAETMLGTLCSDHDAELFVAPEIPMDGRGAARALDACRAAGADFVLVLHGGFTLGDVARTIAASPLRVGFWSVPEPVREGDIQLNNFVSLNMSLSIARQVRDRAARPVAWYHGAPESPALRARLATTLRAIGVVRALEQRRIGVVGGLAMTFYNMEVATSALHARLGVDVAHHDMHEMTGRMAALDPARVAGEQEAMVAAVPVDGVSEAHMALSARAVLALRDMASDHGHDALAVSDWPALQADPGLHPGAAFTWLEERDALPVASEGDILGAVTQLVARSLSGRVGYLLDMTEPDLDAGDLMMWHGGGGPLHLADTSGARWVNHPMIGRDSAAGACHGAIANLVFRDGPVSVFRVAREASALFAMTAEVRGRRPDGFTGCRGWLRDFAIDGERATLADVVATVMAHGLEHHFVLVAGDHAAALAEFAAWAGLQPLPRRPARDHLDARDVT